MHHTHTALTDDYDDHDSVALWLFPDELCSPFQKSCSFLLFLYFTFFLPTWYFIRIWPQKEKVGGDDHALDFELDYFGSKSSKVKRLLTSALSHLTIIITQQHHHSFFRITIVDYIPYHPYQKVVVIIISLFWREVELHISDVSGWYVSSL